MTKLYSDLIDGSSRRYFFGLDSAPSVLLPGVASLTLSGRTPIATEFLTVFRTPTQATLTLQGQTLFSNAQLGPGLTTLTMTAGVVGKQTIQTITNSMIPNYSTPNDLTPTIIYVDTKTPSPAQLTLGTLPFSLTQGGNIGFVFPGVASLTLQGTVANFLNCFPGLASLSLAGKLPVFSSQTATLSPDVMSLTLNGKLVTMDLPFLWITVNRQAATSWVTPSRAA